MSRTPRDKAGRRARVLELVHALPDAQVVPARGRHVQLKVRGKSFAWYVDDHHGDGRVALHCKAARGVQGRLVRAEPARWFVPPYVGPCGWIGLWIDLPAVDWTVVFERLAEAYRLTAPAKLVARLDEGLR